MYYKLSKLSQMYGIPYITIYREIKDNKLSAIRVRNSLYVYYEEWEKYLYEKFCEAHGYDPQKILEYFQQYEKVELDKKVKAISKLRDILTEKYGSENSEVIEQKIVELCKQCGLREKSVNYIFICLNDK